MATTKKLVRSKAGLKIVNSDDNCTSPFTLSEPQWVPDNEASNCKGCKAKFDFIKRKHHCRRCGCIYCGSCCSTKMGLPRMCFVDPVRLCTKCACITGRESEFFDKQLKTLMAGATFFVESSCADKSLSESLVCRLSSDHRLILFEGDTNNSLEPLELSHIKSLGVSRDQDTGASSVDIVYASCNINNGNSKLKLFSGPEPHRKAANLWISAILQAFKFVYENQMNEDK